MANSESELLKESRKAAQRRTDKMYDDNKKKIKRLQFWSLGLYYNY